MPWRLAADALLVLHLGFVLFLLFGGLLVAWKRGFLLLHLPAAAWGVVVEAADRACPLTDWEVQLRLRAGYGEGFVAHYLLPLLYPGWLSLPVQYVLAGVVVAVNLLVYGWVWWYGRRHR